VEYFYNLANAWSRDSMPCGGKIRRVLRKKTERSQRQLEAKAAGLFEGMRDLQDSALAEMGSQDLHADG
jgi:hypothetical protein